MKFRTSQKGFTLVEMIVALAVFTVVALIAVGALLKITSANKKSQTLKTTINNLNFALESMSREIRTGSTYQCGVTSNFTITPVQYTITSTPCLTITSGDWYIAFSSSKAYTGTNFFGQPIVCQMIIAYRYLSATKTLERAKQDYCNAPMNFFGTGLFYPVISPDISLTNAQITVLTGSPTTRQPYVRLHLKGYSGVKERDKTYFDLQTSVSQLINDN